MAINLQHLDCMAVSQDVVYAAFKGYQTGKDLLTLIKTEYPINSTGNITWSVVSTTPINYFGRIGEMKCDVDKDHIFIMWLPDGIGYRYEPLALKAPRAQTCSSDSNGLGEWTRMDLVDPYEVKSWRRLIIQPEVIPSFNNKSSNRQDEGDEMVIYYPQQFPGEHALPIIQYAWINKKTSLNKLTSNNIAFTSLRENRATFEILQYGNGQIYSLLASGPSIAVPIANRTIYNKTLVYFPFEAPFQLTSPPTSAVSVPWNVNCNGRIDVSMAVVIKGKFYFVCTVWNW
ncbi:hypothetical protein BGZ92_001183 [Podila epicladia]|nr:hypothetical protein BGZ92_001183 [Podila epicladia]